MPLICDLQVENGAITWHNDLPQALEFSARRSVSMT